MSLATHIAELERKHQILNEKIAKEISKSGVETPEVSALKKQKLILKDEISRLQTDALHTGLVREVAQ